MANENIPSDAYPLSDQDGAPIPLDIIRAKGLFICPFTTALGDPILFGPNDVTASVYSTEDAIIQLLFPGDTETLPPILPLEPNVDLGTVLFIPKNFVMTVTVTPGNAYVVGLVNSGTMYIQIIEQWAGVALSNTFTRR